MAVVNTHEAKTNLEKIQPSAARQLLLELANYAIFREK